MLLHFSDIDNVFNVDFRVYSTEEDAIDGGRVRTGTFSSSSDDLNAIYNASMYQLH